jgi:tetratricopeptide (TPR) repeat protein
MKRMALGSLLGAAATLLVALPPAVAQDEGPRSSTAELEAIGKLIETGDRAVAEQRLRSVARRFESVRALLLLARLQADRHDLDAAASSLEKARALAPNSEEVLSATAQTLLAAGQTLHAIEVLDALTRLCPTVALYQRLLGTALAQVGDARTATASLDEALRLAPNEVPSLVALGIALNARGHYSEARPHLLRAQSLAPDDVDTSAALAEAEAGLGHLEAAEAAAQRALGQDAAHPRANLAMGIVRLQQERYEEARDALLKAVAADSDPTSAEAHHQLSLAYAALNDEPHAREQEDIYREQMEERQKVVDEARRRIGVSPDETRP